MITGLTYCNLLVEVFSGVDGMAMVFNGSQPSAKWSIGQNGFGGWKAIICAKAGLWPAWLWMKWIIEQIITMKICKPTENQEKTWNYRENPRNQPETMKNHETN